MPHRASRSSRTTDGSTISPEDVKALLRLAVLYNVPIACNRASADFLISSPLFMDAAHLVHRRAERVTSPTTP